MRGELVRLEKSSVSVRDKELLLEFRDHNISKDVSVPRILRLVSALRLTAERIGKGFEEITAKDYEKYLIELKKKNFAFDSIETYKGVLKVFHKWLSGGKEYPACVDWMKISGGKSKKLPEDLLTEEEVKKLIHAVCNKRDKAFIASLWESGARVGELGNLRVKHVTFDELGCQILVDGKTGMRRVRLVSSAPYLLEWLNEHSLRDDPNAPLWIGIEQNLGEQICHNTILKILNGAKRRSGIKKPVNPHHFRHSRATYMAQFLTEAQMKEYFGWVQSSDMASRYVHLSGKQVDDAILKMYGLKKREVEKENVLMQNACPRCKALNDVNNKFCCKCWLAISPGGINEVNETQTKDQEGMIAVMKLLELAGNNPNKVREAITILQTESKGGSENGHSVFYPVSQKQA